MALNAIAIATDPVVLPTVATLSYGMVTIAAGVALCWMGYRLFRVGIYEKGGDLNASWGSKKIALKQAGPGTFFALFGAVILGLAVYKGMTISIPVSSASGAGQATSASTGNVIPAATMQVMLPEHVMLPDANVITGIIQKINAGHPLDENEKKLLLTWYIQQQQLLNNSMVFKAWQPPRSQSEQEKALNLKTKGPA